MNEEFKDTRCPICGGACTKLFEVEIQTAFKSDLYRCNFCYFSFYPKQNWIKDSFSEKLNSLDVGSVDRVLLASDFLTEFIFAQKIRDKKFVDFGGGYGLQTRIMRDRGIDFYNYDPYVKPIFSVDFQANLAEKFIGVSLVEVCLHFEDPISEFEKLVNLADFVIFTTVIPDAKFSENSWYVTGESGQHIAFYSVASLKVIAEKLDVDFYTDGKFFHVFHKKALRIRTRLLFKSRVFLFGLVSVRSILRFVLRSKGKSKSLLQKDQDLAKLKLIS